MLVIEALLNKPLPFIAEFKVKRLNTTTLKYNKPFQLEAGAILPELELAYQALGTINANCSNVVWVCHAFTGSQDAEDWW